MSWWKREEEMYKSKSSKAKPVSSEVKVQDFFIAFDKLNKSEFVNQTNPFKSFFVSIDGVIPQKKEENTMHTETENQRQYLEHRLENIKYAKDRDALKFFHINRWKPSSYKEALELLKAGKFKLDDEALSMFDEDDCGFSNYTFMELIEWDLEPADKAGYKAAQEKIVKAYTDTRDAIKIAAPEKGLEALKAFESTTFH
jgi:hypothetical protein